MTSVRKSTGTGPLHAQALRNKTADAPRHLSRPVLSGHSELNDCSPPYASCCRPVCRQSLDPMHALPLPHQLCGAIHCTCACAAASLVSSWHRLWAAAPQGLGGPAGVSLPCASVSLRRMAWARACPQRTLVSVEHHVRSSQSGGMPWWNADRLCPAAPEHPHHQPPAQLCGPPRRRMSKHRRCPRQGHPIPFFAGTPCTAAAQNTDEVSLRPLPSTPIP